MTDQTTAAPNPFVFFDGPAMYTVRKAHDTDSQETWNVTVTRAAEFTTHPYATRQQVQQAALEALTAGDQP